MIHIVGGKAEKLPDLFCREGYVESRVRREPCLVHQILAVRDEKGDEAARP